MWWHACNSNGQEAGQEHHRFVASLRCIVRSCLREEERGEGRRAEGKESKKRNRRGGDAEEETNQSINQPVNQRSSVLNQSDVRDSEVDHCPLRVFLVFCLSALKDMVSCSCSQIHYVGEDDLKLLSILSLPHGC